MQALLQDIATELAFVETSGESCLRTMEEKVAQLAALVPAHCGELPLVLAAEVNWFGVARQDELKDPAELPAKALTSLHNWFERLASAVDQAYSQALVSDLPDVQGVEAGEAGLTEPALVLKIEEDAELLNEFCIEGRELLNHIEQGVLVLETRPDHMDTLNLVFRAFHTFKGGASFLALDPVRDLAHELESLLDAARRGTMPITTDVIELILAGGDILKRFVDHVDARLVGTPSTALPPVPTLALLARVQAHLQGKPVPVEAQPVPPSPSLPAASQAVAASPAPQFTPPLAVSAPSVQLEAVTQPAAPQAKRAAKPQSKTKASGDRPENLPSFVRLETEKIDSLVDLVGELLIAQSMVVQHPEVQKSEDRDLARHLRQLARITTDLQRNAMSLRMVPIRGAFQKMNRLVRDLAALQGKQIELELLGEEIELDRNIVEQLGDPLIHMVRNSVDHGIEMPAARLAQGKPEQGTIRLQAMHQSGGIVIRISDDGRGMNKDKILAKARERGLVDPEASLSDKDIFELIFVPGFSTAETVTDISGRGVGMDVVRGSITRLRGRIEVQSVLGEGSSFTIRLPLTLAIIDGMLVGVGAERFIIPTLSIRESFRPRPGMISAVPGGQEVVAVRGKLIPLVRLADQLGLESVSCDPLDGIVVVTESGAQVQGFLVDALIGKQEVVIKSLGDALNSPPGMSGAAILGDGLVTLILDPDALGSSMQARALSARVG